MSQIIRATRSPVDPAHGKMRKVDMSGRRYMADSSMRTKPSIDDPSNMILPSSASSNWRSGISTFLIVPRMSVNCRRMNLTFSRSVRSRICALVSFVVFAIGCVDSSQLSGLDPRLKGRQGGAMRILKFLGVLVTLAGVVVLGMVYAPSVYGQSNNRAFAILYGRASELGIRINDEK